MTSKFSFFPVVAAIAVTCFASPVRAENTQTTAVMKAIVAQIDSQPRFPVSDELVAQIEKALADDPQNSAAHLALGSCYDRLAMDELATKEYEKSVEFSKDGPKALIALVKNRFKNGQIRSGTTLLIAAHKRFPEDPEVMFWWANSLKGKDQMQEAARLYDSAFAKSGNNILGLGSAMADVRMREGDYFKAMFMADRDLAIDPNFGLANEIKGSALIHVYYFDKALAPLAKAYKSNPYKREISTQYSFVSAWNGDYKSAFEPALVTLCKQSTPNTRNVAEKRWLIRLMQHLPKSFVAEEITTVGGNLDKLFKNGSFHFALGDALDQSNLHDLALEQYDIGLRFDPNFGRAIFRKGKDLELYKHDDEAALECYKRASDLLPSDPEIADYYRRLRWRMPQKSDDIAGQIKDWAKQMGLATIEVSR